METIGLAPATHTPTGAQFQSLPTFPLIISILETGRTNPALHRYSKHARPEAALRFTGGINDTLAQQVAIPLRSEASATG